MHISPENLDNQDFESMLMSRMSVALLQSSKLVYFKLFRYIYNVKLFDNTFEDTTRGCCSATVETFEF